MNKFEQKKNYEPPANFKINYVHEVSHLLKVLCILIIILQNIFKYNLVAIC